MIILDLIMAENVSSIDYAFTLTLNMRHKTTLDQLYTSRCLLKTAFHKLQHTSIAELTQNGDIHYHGICRMVVDHAYQLPRDMQIYIKDLLRVKGFGYVTVKPIQNYCVWVEYILKDVHSTFRRLSADPIIHDDYQVIVTAGEDYKFHSLLEC